MHDPLAVRSRQAIRHCRADLDRAPPREALARQPRRERLPGQEFRDREMRRAARPASGRVVTELVNREDAGVLDAGERLRLALEAGQPVGIRRHRVG